MSEAVLRLVDLSDAEALHRLFSEPGVRRYLFDHRRLSHDETQAHVEEACAHGGWVVCTAEGIVGLVSLRPVGADRELVVVLSERCWGMGLAYSAARVAMRHGFEVLKLGRILASVDLPNERSHRLMARLGFVPCGESDGPSYRLTNYEALRRSGT